MLVAQSCPTLCDPMDCSPPGSSLYEIFQARILEWIAISFSRGPSQPRDRTQVSCIAGRCFTDWATREATLDADLLENCYIRRDGFDPWVGKIPWRRKWQPAPVSLPGKSHGQRNLVGCSPWGHKELGMTEQVTLTYLCFAFKRHISSMDFLS